MEFKSGKPTALHFPSAAEEVLLRAWQHGEKRPVQTDTHAALRLGGARRRLWGSLSRCLGLPAWSCSTGHLCFSGEALDSRDSTLETRDGTKPTGGHLACHVCLFRLQSVGGSQTKGGVQCQHTALISFHTAWLLIAGVSAHPTEGRDGASRPVPVTTGNLTGPCAGAEELSPG